MPFNALPLAIVDVETTGSRTQNGRIIEIGILRIEGGKLVSSFTSLLNPEQAIPSNITFLTGITDADVNKAPVFNSLSKKILELLDGCVFVAHNASFDYTFLKHEFKRIGIEFNAQTICSVKLSRKLFPEFTQHNLGVLIERYKLESQARHRALDDAKVVWDFLQIIQKEIDPQKLNQAWMQLSRKPVLPDNLNIKSFEDIPDENGVYIFYDEARKPLYVGKASHLREKIMTYFESVPDEGKRATMLKRLRIIETQLTCGDLGAKLLQHHLVKTLKPVFNFPVRIPRDQLKPMRWLYSGAVAIEEKDPAEEGKSDVFCVNEWALFKAMSQEGDELTTLFPCDGKADPALQKILYTYIKNHPDRVKKIDINALFRK